MIDTYGASVGRGIPILNLPINCNRHWRCPIDGAAPAFWLTLERGIVTSAHPPGIRWNDSRISAYPEMRD
jgi:hypothetical protein